MAKKPFGLPRQHWYRTIWYLLNRYLLSGAMEKLRNIGPTSSMWLQEIGVTSRSDIERIGPVFVMQLLLEAGFPVSLNMLYALHGAAHECDWRAIPLYTRLDLKDQWAAIRAEHQPPKLKQRKKKRTS